jgi:hypothetical protein
LYCFGTYLAFNRKEGEDGDDEEEAAERKVVSSVPVAGKTLA